MAQNSKIEWTHHTANLWHGCTKVHEGCDHCYAETLSKRWGRDIWGNDKPRMEIKSVWNDLKKYQQMAAAAGEIHRVFVGSMMDIFEKPMPLMSSKGEQAIDFSDGSQIDNSHLRERFFNETIPQSPNLLFLLLTKRPSNINKYIPESWKTNPPENVMFGTSPVNQATADKLIPQLLQVKGRKFLSCEPLLGTIDIINVEWGAYQNGNNSPLRKRLIDGIDWVICGGESGHGARPMHPEWARSLRDQCNDADVQFLFKQWGEWRDGAKGDTPVSKWVMVGNNGQLFNNEDIVPRGINCTLMTRVGKKEAGRMLDGITHDEFPTNKYVRA